ncbi:hypothetical protein DFH05DRAFT_887581 [Lentinula detonsa]|uniref:Uncharacterized protein n=1 Tax=Lentinula detonsa TaxID=2804962 RepID=A0A9W8U0R2_9AGAR|nr:hypothetical protein DFH05DRAFT_887581 [Lentinula detonsa]
MLALSLVSMLYATSKLNQCSVYSCIGNRCEKSAGHHDLRNPLHIRCNRIVSQEKEGIGLVLVTTLLSELKHSLTLHERVHHSLL